MKRIKENFVLVLVVLVLGVLGLVVFLFKRGAESSSLKRAIKKRQEDRITGSDGTSISLPDIAYEIYDAFYGQLWGMTEDEEQAIKALQRVPAIQVPQLAVEYGKIEKKNKNLYHDFRRYLNDKEYDSVRAWLK